MVAGGEGGAGAGAPQRTAAAMDPDTIMHVAGSSCSLRVYLGEANYMTCKKKGFLFKRKYL